MYMYSPVSLKDSLRRGAKRALKQVLRFPKVSSDDPFNIIPWIHSLYKQLTKFLHYTTINAFSFYVFFLFPPLEFTEVLKVLVSRCMILLKLIIRVYFH